MTSAKESGAPEVDLEAAAKLVAALERDLGKVSGDSSDIQRLRDEVQTLKNVLSSPSRKPHRVRDALHGIRESFSHVMDEAATDVLKGGQYVAEIGRILGL